MMNGILTALLIFSVVTAAFTGRMEALSAAALSGCGEAVSLVIALTGMLPRHAGHLHESFRQSAGSGQCRYSLGPCRHAGAAKVESP